MKQPMVTRTQRRVEKKQVWLVLALMAGVAVVSFALGVMVGQQGGSLPGFGAATVPEVQMATAIPVPVPAPPVATPAQTQAQEAVQAGEPAKLTFYDNLPQGSQAPLGSGINLPPQQNPPPVAQPVDKVKPEVKPAPVAVEKPPVAAATKVALPGASPSGEFVVQIASFKLAEDAAKLTARLKAQRVDVFVERADLGAKGVWHRVLAGPYGQRETADQVAARLKTEERLSVLVRRR